MKIAKIILIIDFLTLITSLLLWLLFISQKGLFLINIIYPIIFLFYSFVFKSIIGIILFLINLFRKSILIANKFYVVLIIPSILLSSFLIFNSMMIIKNNLYTGGMILPSFIIAIGLPFWISNWFINKDLNFKVYIKIILSILTPTSFYFIYLLMWSIIGL